MRKSMQVCEAIWVCTYACGVLGVRGYTLLRLRGVCQCTCSVQSACVAFVHMESCVCKICTRGVLRVYVSSL